MSKSQYRVVYFFVLQRFLFAVGHRFNYQSICPGPVIPLINAEVQEAVLMIY